MTLHRNSNNTPDPEENKIQPRKTRNKRKNRKRLAVVIVLELALVAALIVFLKSTSVESRFIRAVRHGVTTGWSESVNETQFSDSGAKHDTSFIKDEYDAVKSFKGRRFRDKKLGAIASEYIDALEGCAKAAKENDPAKEYDSFWNGFSQSYGRRVDALYRLYKGDYGLTFDEEKYSDEIDNILINGWSLEKSGQIEFRREIQKNEPEEGSEEEPTESVYYTATVKNDSGFDLAYFNVTVDLYDKDGKVIEEVSAYCDKIKKGQDFELKCYQTSDAEAETYVISSVESHIQKAKAEESKEQEPEENKPQSN